MKQHRKSRHRRSEAGIALLISIFVLLLVSVVAIALLVSSGTETALGANYRSSTNVYYAALAGLEEARGRLLTKNPDYFNIANPGFMPAAGTQLAVGEVRYVVNPDANALTAYPDNEFSSEFPGVTPTSRPTAPSVSGNNAQGIPGPLFKWVRITAATEWSLGIDVDGDGNRDQTTALYYDPLHVDGSGNLQPSLIVSASPPPTAVQALEITSLGVLPNGSQKLVQYLVAPAPVNIPNFLPNFLSNFPAALILAGSDANGVAFSSPTSNTSYYSSGVDLTGLPGCTAGSAVHAIGVFTDDDKSNVINGGNGGTGILPNSMQPSYNGISAAPDVANVSSLFPLQTPSQFNALAQVITQNADVVITPSSPSFTATASNLNTLAMSPSNPLTVVINGNLDLNAWYHTGYGLLLVTGNLNYDPDTSWQGIVMVIGQGSVTGSKGGIGEFDGAFLVAKTRDSSGALLPDPNLGKASMIFATNMGAKGFRYSSCWIQKARPTGNFKVLSFREIPQ